MLFRILAPLFLGATLLAQGKVAADDKTRIGNSTIERTVQLRTHSLYAPYIDQELQNRWWDFGADSYVNTNKHIRLTRAAPSQTGWLWSRLPITAANYVVEVEFKISGDMGHLYGDGLAMWFTKERAQEGPIFGSKDQFEGLGIFLDTYANSRHGYNFPRVSAFLGDGKTSYDYDHDGEATSLGGCSANFRRTNVATKLKVTYVKNSFLDVKIQYRAWDDWSDCIHIKNITLPHAPFIGFTAMTGDVYDAHDIIAVSSYSAILSSSESQRDTLKASSGPFFFPGETGGRTWFGTLLRLFVLVGLVAGCWYGYKEYIRRKTYGGLGGGLGMGRGGGAGGFGGLYGDNSGNKRMF